jgi:hypothetical protein
MTDENRDALVDVARLHAAVEGAGDAPATLATLDADPSYELLPIGLIFRGREAVHRCYEHFFANFHPRIKDFALHGEWISDEGVLHEYTLHIENADGSTTPHRLAVILKFGHEGKLSGERIYASDALFELMFGSLLSRAEPMQRR